MSNPEITAPAVLTIELTPDNLTAMVRAAVAREARAARDAGPVE